MAWTSPRTWVAGELVTAALLNAHLRDNLNAVVPNGPDGWSSYTPTLTQSGAVTKTVTYAKYMKVGRLVVANVLLAVTGAGTAGVKIQVSLPVTPAFSASNAVMGSFWLVDASASTNYSGAAVVEPGALVIGIPNAAAAGLGQASMTAALASGDTVGMSVSYESST